MTRGKSIPAIALLISLVTSTGRTEHARGQEKGKDLGKDRDFEMER